MSKFNPSMLVPALAADKGSAARSAKDVALGNINRMKEQFAAGDAAEGKINFKGIDGGRVAFTIRVSNTPLVLEKTKVEDTEVEVREMSIPKANFTEALDYYADRIKAGEYDAQLATLTEKKAARTDKLRQTRATKKAAEPAK
ncbi:hypothetical protein [Sphingomonas sp. Leaf28]|uniref:hypothetical protein n=1 Tax=Sphingomonas sp. Leaf28 TaxID=1735695 RepID=UPI0006F6AD1E|nr:hypothetical protein [Sphingomonas sp. Leaf28]KQN09094.1 hypothetical protein ASE79_14675 [Sphingomonas sp. Leaf28]